MSKSNVLEAAILNHLFCNAAISLVGDATGLPAAATVGSLYLSLHTADPGEAGDQTTSEVAYTGYARVAVARDNTHWTVSGTAPTQCALAARATFPQRSDAASSTVTHFGIGTSSTGAGKLLYSGAFDSSFAVAQWASPYIEAGTKVTED